MPAANPITDANELARRRIRGALQQAEQIKRDPLKATRRARGQCRACFYIGPIANTSAAGLCGCGADIELKARRIPRQAKGSSPEGTE